MKNNPPRIKADLIIIALLENGTQERAATALGFSETTVWRWLQKPEFQDQYHAARRQEFAQSKGLLQQAAPAAAAILLRIMRDKKASAACQLRAAKSILKHANEFGLETLRAQVDRLEQMRNDSSNASPRESAFAPLGERAETLKKMSSAALKTERIVAALIEHGSQAQAAASLGISVPTVWRHLQTPECQKQLAKARGEAYSRALVLLQHAAKTAALTLSSLMLDERTPATIRVQAADSILEYCSDCAREDVQARVKELEQSESATEALEQRVCATEAPQVREEPQQSACATADAPARVEKLEQTNRALEDACARVDELDERFCAPGDRLARAKEMEEALARVRELEDELARLEELKENAA